ARRVSRNSSVPAPPRPERLRRGCEPELARALPSLQLDRRPSGSRRHCDGRRHRPQQAGDVAAASVGRRARVACLDKRPRLVAPGALSARAQKARSEWWGATSPRNGARAGRRIYDFGWHTTCATAAAQQGVNLDQCANGALGSSSSCPPGWQNGNLNPQNSTYREGDSVPFRAILTGLSSGQHTILIQYDTTQGGKHAYDYLTSFGRTVAGVDPCDGVASCSGPGTDFGPIPVSNNPTVPSIGVVPDAQRAFTIWNGTITNASLGGASDVAG